MTIIFEKEQLFIQAGCSVGTPCFSSLAEKVELNIEGHGKIGTEIVCKVKSYNDIGVESLVHAEHVELSKQADFRMWNFRNKRIFA